MTNTERKEKARAASQRYQEANREKLLERRRQRYAANLEKEREHPSHKNYVGMPFEPSWNPAVGGSFSVGQDQILADIGHKPKGSSLHIVDHAKGFVRGNLVWTTPANQNREQLRKISARQSHRINELETKDRIQNAMLANYYGMRTAGVSVSAK